MTWLLHVWAASKRRHSSTQNSIQTIWYSWLQSLCCCIPQDLGQKSWDATSCGVCPLWLRGQTNIAVQQTWQHVTPCRTSEWLWSTAVMHWRDHQGRAYLDSSVEFWAAMMESTSRPKHVPCTYRCSTVLLFGITCTMCMILRVIIGIILLQVWYICITWYIYGTFKRYNFDNDAVYTKKFDVSCYIRGPHVCWETIAAQWAASNEVCAERHWPAHETEETGAHMMLRLTL